MGNLELNGADPFTFTGGLTLESPGPDIVSSFSGTPKLEWWADSTISYLFHRPASSYLLVSDSTGNWGIGTPTPADRLHVSGSVRANAFVDGNNASFLVDPAGTSTIASLLVSGTSFIGHEIVSTTYLVNTQVVACPTYGDQTCYTGSGCAACSSGKVVIGGGCNGGPAQWAQVGASYPSGTTGWCCNTSYDISGSDTAYAICARVGN